MPTPCPKAISPRRSQKNIRGAYDQVKVSVNSTVDALTKIVEEIRNIVEDAAVRGSFATKMDMTTSRATPRPCPSCSINFATSPMMRCRRHRARSQALAKGDLTQTITKEYPVLSAN